MQLSSFITSHSSVALFFTALFIAVATRAAEVPPHAVPDRESAIYAPDETIRFKIRELPAETTRATFRVLDLERREAHAGEIAVPQETILLPELPLGYYDFEFHLFDAGNRELASGRYPFAVIPRVDHNRPDWRKNQFGAMVMPHTAYPLADRRRDAEFMNRIGIRFVRTQRLNWVQIQPDPKRPPDWETADREVEIYMQNHLDIVSNTAWPLPSHASEGFGKSKLIVDKMYPAADKIETIRDFYAELGRRYKGKVAYWEVGNEVDAALFWTGRLEHAESGDKDAIIQDFCDYFVLIARALKSGDPAAQVGPNTTGRAPDGHTYRDWLRKFLSNDAAKREMNFFSTHYRADFDGIDRVFRENGVPENTDVIVTEIGGMGSKIDSSRSEWQQLNDNIRITYVQCAAALTANAKALCKFLLRDIPNVSINEIAGMLEADFRLRPEFVAYATMIREIGFSSPAGELNVVHHASDGWLNCWAFDAPGRRVNLVVLNDAENAEVTFNTPDSEVRLIDPMGRERRLPAQSGKVSFPITRAMPLFVVGNVIPDPGPAQYPQPVAVRTVDLTVNGNFEEPAGINRIPGWKVIADEIGGTAGDTGGTFTVSVDPEVKTDGRQALKMHADRKTQWYGVMLNIPADQLPLPGIGETLELTVRYQVKTADVRGTGTAVTISQRDRNGQRLAWKDSAFEWGTFGWEEKNAKFVFDRFPPELGSISVEFYLGQATGTVWIDEVEVTATLWRQPGADTRRVN